MPETGLEPVRLIQPEDFKSSVSTNFTTPAKPDNTIPEYVGGSTSVRRCMPLSTGLGTDAAGVLRPFFQSDVSSPLLACNDRLFP